MTNIKHYPRLFCVDLIEKHKIDALKTIKKATKPQITSHSSTNQQGAEHLTSISRKKDNTIIIELIPCIQAMCESEDGWHLSKCIVPLKEMPTEYCSYLLRIMNILKNGPLSNHMKLFLTDQGTKLLNEIEAKSSQDQTEVSASYIALRSFFIERIDSNEFYSFDSFGNASDKVGEQLTRCKMKNHKVLWLCDEHVEKLEVKVLSDSTEVINTAAFGNQTYELLEDIEKIRIEDFNINERT